MTATTKTTKATKPATKATKPATRVLKNVSFDLTAITSAAHCMANTEAAFSEVHALMLTWHGMGLYPTVEAVTAALLDGYAKNPNIKANEKTLTNYAHGILKWAKVGKTPKALSMRAFQGNPNPTPKAKEEEPAKATGELTPLAKAKAWCNELQANRLKFLGTADAAAFEEGMLVCLAILNRVKG